MKEFLHFLLTVWSDPWTAVVGDFVLAVVITLISALDDETDSWVFMIAGTGITIVCGVVAAVFTGYTMWHYHNFAALGFGIGVGIVLSLVGASLLWRANPPATAGIVVLWLGTAAAVIEMIVMTAHVVLF